ncbi:MAG TPA: VWA domain-containing protein, partial [Candidatus Angelobacter sp.]|nr:VWA domain-containing protein [Candidatus Angelobacter sp.]
MDVVVTDSNGNPVTGLTQNDFRVFEDDKQQSIASFKEHAGAPVTTVDLPPLPPNVYTNTPAVGSADSINVLLLDSLNTQMTDQQFVHQQTIKYLKTIPAGARIAIFTLSSRLRMVQEFTSDSSRLLAALNDPALSGPRHSALLKSQAESQADDQMVAEAKLNQIN